MDANVFEYGPFGEVLRATGPMAKVNAFRFSTKYQDDETDLLYYGYRDLKTTTGGWLSRDPINELGHHVLTEERRFGLNLDEEKNLYSLVRNNAANLYDADGRALGPILVIGGVSVAAALCIRSQYEIAHNRYVGDREGHPVSDPAGDSFVHCWTSCRISKVCGGGLAQLAGLGKEGLDSFRRAWREVFGGEDETGHGSWLDSLDDLVANQQCIGWESYAGPVGGWIGAACRRSCEDCCREKVGYHTSGHD